MLQCQSYYMVISCFIHMFIQLVKSPKPFRGTSATVQVPCSLRWGMLCGAPGRVCPFRIAAGGSSRIDSQKGSRSQEITANVSGYLTWIHWDIIYTDESCRCHTHACLHTGIHSHGTHTTTRTHRHARMQT